jgi:hypothetical protein
MAVLLQFHFDVGRNGRRSGSILRCFQSIFHPLVLDRPEDERLSGAGSSSLASCSVGFLLRLVSFLASPADPRR